MSDMLIFMAEIEAKRKKGGELLLIRAALAVLLESLLLSCCATVRNRCLVLYRLRGRQRPISILVLAGAASGGVSMPILVALPVALLAANNVPHHQAL